jgi:hypothetical protein
VDETGNLPAVETHEPAELHCHNCGARHDRFQEYCLECGARLTPLPQFGAGPGSPYWFWASLIALLVLALITAAVVIAATDDDDGAGTSSGVSTPPATVVPTGLTTETLGPPTLPTSSGFVPTVPSTTFSTTTAPTTTAPTTTAQTTTQGTTTNASGLTQWPAGQSGYTAILESVPASEGKAVAEQKAQAAKNKGLSEVGVLDSDNFQGLTPNLWVVFSGVKNTQSAAEQNVTAAKSAGYSGAYVRQIVPK